ncbi:MAG: hypothetical protein HY610_00635, partial [Elusimicrobia bacterium]|nr:hypothetical protein [Elusimicrobiota bacterium]
MIKYWREKKHQAVTRFIAGTLAFSMLWTTISAPIAQANLWQERRNAVKEYQKKSQERVQLASAQMGSVIAPQGGILAPHRIGSDISEIEQSLQQNESRLDIERLYKEAMAESPAQKPLLSGKWAQVPQWLSEKVSRHGTIENVYLNEGQEILQTAGKMDSKTPLIIHLQDAHDVYSAQKSLAFLLTDLMGLGVEMVGLEGSEGTLQGIETWRKYPDRGSMLEMAGALMKDGLLTGAEIAGLSRENDSVEFYGLEEKDSYLDQVNSFKETLAHKGNVKAWKEEVESVLQKLKQKEYSAFQKDLDQRQTQFEKNEIRLGAWVEFLAKPENRAFAESPNRYPNVSKFFRAYQIEKKLDFQKVSIEQKELLHMLSDKLTQPELMGLLR